MKGAETMLVKFLEGSDKRFVIPVYQRNYDWKMGNCRQLYDDLVKVAQRQRKSHFFGSIVSVYNPDGANEEFQIIDGQQRLTTVSLLLLAMHNLLRQGIIASEAENLPEQIYKKYLVDEWKPKETRIKLKPVKNDQAVLKQLFDETTEQSSTSNLVVNYNYFYERIQKEEISVDSLFDAIRRLQIISITLNQDDNPQLIFESLNSTGLALSEGDKIRNYILMGLPTEQQQEFYEKYWNKIEECTDYQIDAFIRDYLSVKQQSTPIMNKIYFAFKHYVEEIGQDTETLLKDVLNYARLYATLLRGDTADDKRLAACINRLNRLETTVTRPFFLEVLRMKREGTLSTDDAVQIFLVTENYLFRRTICDVPTNALNKIFLLLHKEIIGYDGSADRYVDKFVYALRSKRERARFPGDKEFSDAFGSRDIYRMNGKNRAYIMERLENFGTSEDKDVYRHLDDGEYSVEHIMPQHLTPAWRDELGEDYAAIHETWLHRAANLTLTAYNPKLSNSTFAEKRDMKDFGFKESGLRMNQKIAQKARWGLAELTERNDYLCKRALAIWNAPETDFVPLVKQFDYCTLEDDTDLTGRTITRFVYRGAEQPVESWADMFNQVVRLLYSEDKSVMTRLSYANGNAPIYVSRNKENLRKFFEIGDGIYVERNTSTEMKRSVLRRLFKEHDVEPSELVFYLSDSLEEKAEEKESRYELRKRYWAYALPEIKRENKGPFSNVNPSKDNWVNGFFGIGGFSLACVANFGEARAELVFSKADNAENKKAYDAICSHKTEIEAALGEALIWDRGEDKKSCKIFRAMERVSIEKEDDWPTMARFHAKWTRRLYDAIVVPYLLPMYGL